MVDVGGHQLHLVCQGEGSPTVILEQGGGGTSLAWFNVQPRVAEVTRVCAYDRAGLGWSQTGPEPRDGTRIAEELHALLDKAGEVGPFVMAGWSYGGLFVRAFAERYPAEVVGVALLDSTHPEVWTRTAEGRSQFETDSRIYGGAQPLARLGLLRLLPNPLTQTPDSWPARLREQWHAVSSTTKYWDTVAAESRAVTGTMARLHGAGSLGDIPLVVVTAGANSGADGQWATYQRELANLSSNSDHVTLAGAQHISLWADPEYAQATSAQIVRAVEAARTGSRLAP
jgi:pimeloyl-ACP methyl ester carboxylesterase